MLGALQVPFRAPITCTQNATSEPSNPLDIDLDLRG
jgi:hypothetical protein